MMGIQDFATTMCKVPGIGGLGIMCPVLDIVNKKESFNNTNNADSVASATIGSGIVMILMTLINIAVCITAFYYVFKCGGHFIDFLAACCCSLLYIAYRLAVPCASPTITQF